MKNRINQLLFVILGALLASSCGSGEQEQIIEDKAKTNEQDAKIIESFPDATKSEADWKKENVIVYHTLGDPDDMHPTNGNSAQRSEIHLYTQVNLINFDFQNLKAFPHLAKAMPSISADGLTYTFELKDYFKWDDGSQITTDDVIFTFKASKCPLTNNPHAKPYLEHISDMKTDPTNKNVLIVKMKDRYVQNIWLYTDFCIIQQKIFDPENILSKYTFQQFDDPTFKADAYKDLKEWGIYFNDAKFSHTVEFLVGGGPYKIEKWESGQSLVLTKKKNHWTNGRSSIFENAYPEKIIFKINKDPNSVLLDFKSQVFDASAYIDTRTLLELQADPKFNKNYNSKFVDSYNYSYIAMNMKADGVKHKKLFTDAKVRRAMAMLTPYNDVNKVAYSNTSKRTVGAVSHLKVEYNDELKLIEFDVEGAKKLLTEAGWKDTDGDQILDKVVDGVKVNFNFKITYMTTTVAWADIAKLTSEAMQKAGIKAELLPVEFNVFVENARKHDFDMIIGSWGAGSVPEDFTQVWHSTSWASNGSNFSGFGNATSDALIDSIKVELDDVKRIAMVKKFQEIVYNEQPFIFLFASKRKMAIHKRFGNQEMYYERPGLLLNNLKLIQFPDPKP